MSSFHKSSFCSVEHSTPVGRELEKLLLIPINNLNDMLTVLSLKHFAPLMNLYDFDGRRAMAVYIATNVVDNETTIPTAEETEVVLDLLAPLVSDQEDGPKPEQWDDQEEFAEEQSLMGKVIHLLKASESADMQYQILSSARKHFGQGGPKRIGATLPSIVISAFKLAQEFYSIKKEDDKWEKKVAKIFQFCHTTITALVKAEMSELPLRLFLQGALVLDTIPFENQETVAYEYMSQV